MISEHNFASSYGSVWQQITPRSDGYWKFENMLVTREAPPIPASAPTNMRGVVNEAAFRAFCILRAGGREFDGTTILNAIDAQAPDAVEYVSRLAPRSRSDLQSFDDSCRQEAVSLTIRLLRYFRGYRRTTLQPRFRGCGLISACEGDVLANDCLYEIKAGERAFRITDLRQLLVYSALAYASDSLEFTSIGLFNPRTGAAWTRTLDQVCQSIAGLQAIDILSALASQFSAISVSR